PGDGEAKRGQGERHQKHGEDDQPERSQRHVYADERREDQENQSLGGGERGAAQDFSQNNGRARHRRHQHRKQKTFVAVLDYRHHGENRGEEHDHHQRSGIEIIQIVLLAGGLSGTKRRSETAAEDDPEQKWRNNYAHHTRALTITAYDFAPP